MWLVGAWLPTCSIWQAGCILQTNFRDIIRQVLSLKKDDKRAVTALIA